MAERILRPLVNIYTGQSNINNNLKSRVLVINWLIVSIRLILVTCITIIHLLIWVRIDHLV